MKKLIVTTLSILMLFTTSIISTFASSEAPFFNEPTLEDVKAVYYDIFYNYKYDKELMKLAQKEFPFNDLQKTLRYDVAFMEKYRGGGCRQFANLFIDRLTKIGVKAYALTMGDSKDLIESHTTVVYEFDGKKYVSDIVQSKYAQKLGIKHFNKHDKNHVKKGILFFHLPLDAYCNKFKETYDIFYIIDIDKDKVEKLEI